ncbi:MAG: signal peptidase II [Eubacteriales bacterium]
MNFNIILIIIAAGGIAVDQITKLIVASNMQLNDTLPIIKNVLHITYIKNEGAAFGMLSNHRWIFMSISAVAIVALCVYLFRFSKDTRLMKTGIALIISGGIGNMIDRIFLGYVVDMIDFRLINFYIFNVADACVSVGAAVLILGIVLNEIKTIKAKKAGEQNDSVAK